MSNLFTFLKFLLLCEVDHRESCFDLCHWVFCSMFFSKSFIVFGLTFRSLFCFEVIFLYGIRKVFRRRRWHATPVLLHGKSFGWKSLVGGYSPWGHNELDTTKWLHFHFSLSCIGEVNGKPLQCSCLENLRDGGAWWAAVYGVAQSWARLKWLSSSSYIMNSVKAKSRIKNSQFLDISSCGFCTTAI